MSTRRGREGVTDRPVTRIRRNDPDARLRDSVQACGISAQGFSDEDWRAFDRTAFPALAAQLRNAETEIRSLRLRLETEARGPATLPGRRAAGHGPGRPPLLLRAVPADSAPRDETAIAA